MTENILQFLSDILNMVSVRIPHSLRRGPMSRLYRDQRANYNNRHFPYMESRLVGTASRCEIIPSHLVQGASKENY